MRAGCRGIVADALHFTRNQLDVLPDFYRDLESLANLPPAWLTPLLSRFRDAAHDHGLLFDATSRHNHHLGLSPRHIECADPTWLGRVFDAPQRILAAADALAAAHPDAPVLLGWPEIRAALVALGVPDEPLDAAPFWYAYNCRQTASHPLWKARLGKRSTFHEILRHWWNHPWETAAFLWHHRSLRPVWNPARKLLVGDDDGDAVALVDLTREPGSGKDVDRDLIDWPRAVWPVFGD